MGQKLSQFASSDVEVEVDVQVLNGRNVHSYTVNSLVSDHSWCTKKWSLKEGRRLHEKSTK